MTQLKINTAELMDKENVSKRSFLTSSPDLLLPGHVIQRVARMRSSVTVNTWLYIREWTGCSRLLFIILSEDKDSTTPLRAESLSDLWGRTSTGWSVYGDHHQTRNPFTVELTLAASLQHSIARSQPPAALTSTIRIMKIFIHQRMVETITNLKKKQYK